MNSHGRCAGPSAGAHGPLPSSGTRVWNALRLLGFCQLCCCYVVKLLPVRGQFLGIGGGNVAVEQFLGDKERFLGCGQPGGRFGVFPVAGIFHHGGKTCLLILKDGAGRCDFAFGGLQRFVFLEIPGWWGKSAGHLLVPGRDALGTGSLAGSGHGHG